MTTNTTTTTTETREYHRALRRAVETGDLMPVETVLAHYGVTLTQDTDSAAQVTSIALRRHIADALAYGLRHACEGITEVSTSPDCDDPSVAWVYVTFEA